jgi:hypothetical protein
MPLPALALAFDPSHAPLDEHVPDLRKNNEPPNSVELKQMTEGGSLRKEQRL